MELKDTISGMVSEDYKERFRAEYWQTSIRTAALAHIIINYNKLNFKTACPKNILEEQLKSMSDYLNILQKRAIIEKIPLIKEENKNA